MFQLDERTMADNRSLISIQSSKTSIDRLVKNGTINYVIDTNDLYLTTPRSKVYNEYYRVIQEDPTGTIPNNLTFGGDIIVKGNFKVLGTQTIIDTPTLSIEDNIIEINKNENGAGITLGSSGIQVNRGTKGNANWLFSESVGGFTFDTNGTPAMYIYTEGTSAGNAKIVKNLSVQGVTATGAISGSSTLSITGATTLGSTLGVTGAATLGSTLTTSGATTINNTLTASGAGWFKSTLKADGAATLGSTLSVASNATIGGTLGVTGAATLSDTLSVVKAATLQDNLSVVKNATVGGTLDVTGAATFDSFNASSLSASGNASVGGTMNITGATTASSATFSGAVQINSTLGATGIVTFGDDLKVGGDLVVTGTSTLNGITTINNKLTVGAFATSLGGTLGVTGAATFGSTLSAKGTTVTTIHATGAATLDSTLSVGTNATIGGTLGVTGLTTIAGLNAGATTLASLGVTNDTTVGGSLGVTGAVTFGSTAAITGALTGSSATFSGALTANSLTVNTTSLLKGAVTANSTLSVGTNATVGGTLGVTGSTTLAGLSAGATSISSTLNVTGASTLAGLTAGATTLASLGITGAATVGTTLSVGGASTLTGAVAAKSTLTVTGATTLNSTLHVVGASTLASLNAVNGDFSGTLNADGIATLGSTLTVTGATSLNNNLAVAGTIYGKSTLTIDGAAEFNSTMHADSSITSDSFVKATNFAVTSVDGDGLKFWDSDNYKIWMSSGSNATYGGRLGETTSDYNMYFKMSGGTNRGFVFLNGTAPHFTINPDAIRSAKDMYIRDAADTTRWYKVYHEGNLTTSELDGGVGATAINTTGAGNIVNFQVNGVTKSSIDNTGKFTGKVDWANINNKPVFSTDSITSSGTTYANTTGTTNNIVEFRVNGVVKSAINKDGDFTGNVTTVAAQTAYSQDTATTTMSINHGMNKMPSVIITDTNGNMIIAEIRYVDANNITINFAEAYTGTVYLQ